MESSSRSTTPKPTSNPKAKPRPSRKTTRRARTGRVQFYGYAFNRAWLEAYGRKYTPPPPNESTPVSSAAFYNGMKKIIQDAGLSTWYNVKADEHDFARSLTCFAVGHNKTQEGLDSITPERIERLKKVLGTSEEPRWWTI